MTAEKLIPGLAGLALLGACLWLWWRERRPR